MPTAPTSDIQLICILRTRMEQDLVVRGGPVHTLLNTLNLI
jgi:hypothetical protein